MNAKRVFNIRQFIGKKCRYRFEDTHPVGALVRLFVDSVNEIFSGYSQSDKLHIAGTQNLLDYPEFEDIGRVRSVIELVENEDIIIHMLDKYEGNDAEDS